ncbi:hypothetical protein PRIPAC_94140, partial [Pristionchus pacificus]|uniref:Uncharacterized protein n=1 Tax=Pristionchus pacificus TaxID=54126 RepID=A0A2A6CIP3_PRIPA
MLGDFTLVDVLDRDMKCFQLENGTIFRFKKSEPQQLLFKETDDFSSTIISVVLPDGKIEQMTAPHNRLYFNTDARKVYCVEKYQVCAVFFLRDLNE